MFELIVMLCVCAWASSFSRIPIPYCPFGLLNCVTIRNRGVIVSDKYSITISSFKNAVAFTAFVVRVQVIKLVKWLPDVMPATTNKHTQMLIKP